MLRMLVSGVSVRVIGGSETKKLQRQVRWRIEYGEGMPGFLTSIC